MQNWTWKDPICESDLTYALTKTANTFLFTYLFITRYLLPPTWGRHASCHEKIYNKIKEIKINFPLYALWLSHRWTSTHMLHIAFTTHYCFISSMFWVYSLCIPFLLTNPRHTLLSCTIPLACLTSKHVFFKYFFTVSILLFHGIPTECLPAHYPS